MMKNCNVANKRVSGVWSGGLQVEVVAHCSLSLLCSPIIVRGPGPWQVCLGLPAVCGFLSSWRKYFTTGVQVTMRDSKTRKGLSWKQHQESQAGLLLPIAP